MTAVFCQAAAETVAYTFKFNWDGSLLAAADQKGNINVYNIPGKKLEYSFYKAGEPAFLDFSTDNRYLACGFHSGRDICYYYVWDLDSGAPVLYWDRKADYLEIMDLAFIPTTHLLTIWIATTGIRGFI